METGATAGSNARPLRSGAAAGGSRLLYTLTDIPPGAGDPMVRSVARGQFRVTAAWHEPSPSRDAGPEAEVEETAAENLPALLPPTAVSLRRPSLFERVRPVSAPPAPPSEEPEAPEPPESAGPPGPTPVFVGAPRGPLRVTFAWPEPTPAPPPLRQEELEPQPTPPPVPVLEPPVSASPEPSPEGESRRPAPATPPASTQEGATVPEHPPETPEPSRVLVSLLARMWLMRTGTAATGGVAIPAPASPTVEAAAPVPPVPPAAAARILPPAPTAEPPVLVREPPRPPDIDDRRPLSGLASFLVEVADVAHPPEPPPPPLPQPPPLAVLLPGREHVVIVRLVHCHHPIPERPVSRDSCRQPRYGR